MADGLCTEDTVGNIIENTLVKDYTNIVKCVNTNGVNDIACANVKSFYIDSDSGKLCGQVCSLKGADTKHEGFLEMPCSPSDDCRKKRCADRYDSSESSDSGVAVLSCTDCSTYSGGSSDITDPGSPYSSASSHSDDLQQQQQQQHAQPQPQPPPPWWHCDTQLKRHTTTTTAATTTIKRLKTNVQQPQQHTPANNRSIVNKLNSSHISQDTRSTVRTVTIAAKNANSSISCSQTSQDNKRTILKMVTSPQVSHDHKRATMKKPNETVDRAQQGKITEYFKSQMKPNKKELSNIVVKSVVADRNTAMEMDLHKYITLINGPKVILKGKCAKFPSDLYQINVRALTEAVPVKKVLLDTKTKKLSPVVTLPRKILPAPAPTPTLGTPTTPSSRPVYLAKAPAKPPDAKSFLSRSTHPLAMPPLHKTMPVTNLNLKVSSTVVPIVKLNSMPLKLHRSNVHHNVNSLSVETAVPTIPTAKLKSSAITVTNCFSKATAYSSSTSVPPRQSFSASNGVCQKQSHSIHNGVCQKLTFSGLKNSVVEQNVTTESIKSLDSDSGVSSVRDSLSVSVAGSPCVEVTPQQKSPILSQPKTIRFPAKQQSTTGRRTDAVDSGLCRWTDCQAHFDTSGALLDHLQVKHVLSQVSQEHYVCLWQGCKVHGRTSCSRSWLERHVLGHAGSKPFRCIVDGCGTRFSSQQTLEKHVNSHFNASENGSSGTSKKSLESGSAKLFKRNGKKLRYRRQPWSARMFDFFDAGIMEGLQHRLVTMSEKCSTTVTMAATTRNITLRSRVIARRVAPDGSRQVLLRWFPPHIVPDEWVLESQIEQSRTVSVPSLEPAAMDALADTLFPARPHPRNRRKPHPKLS